MTERDFSAFKVLLEREYGLSMKNQTRESLAKKIHVRLRTHHFASYKEYLAFLSESPLAKAELLTLPRYLMNTESYFLREMAQFRQFLELYRITAAEKRSEKIKTVRILSAGCSEGQEPYSIVMMLRNAFPALSPSDISVSGLDINAAALEAARRAVYSEYALRGDHSGTITQYFEKSAAGSCDAPKKCFILKPEIAGSVDFFQSNILHPLVLQGFSNIDFLFCRNVLMYMSSKAADTIALNLWESLANNGYLFVGQSESLHRRDDLFTAIRCSDVLVYRKNSSSSTA